MPASPVPSNLEFPAQPPSRRPWENQPNTASSSGLSQEASLARSPGVLHTDGVSGTSSYSWISANSSAPQSDPSLGKPQFSWANINRCPEAWGPGPNHPPAYPILTAPLCPSPACPALRRALVGSSVSEVDQAFQAAQDTGLGNGSAGCKPPAVLASRGPQVHEKVLLC